MKVLTLAYDDYANLAFDHTRAMRSVGIDARSMKLKAHAFNYEHQAKVSSADDMEQAMKDVDVIMIYHSHPVIFSIVKNFVNKYPEPRTIIGFHSGSIYRNDPFGTCDMFNSIGCKAHLTDQCEFLMTPGYDELHYVASAIDIPAIRAQGLFPKVQDGMIRLAHYPSKPEVKGSKDILRMVASCSHDTRIRFKYSDQRVSNRENLQRMSDCDAYIELFMEELEGKAYGCHGVTAFEVAALGRVVVTQNIYQQAYTEAYGVEQPFLIANTEEQFMKHMKWLAGASSKEIMILQQKTYEWVNQYHSMEATGNRLKKILQDL